MNGTELPDGSAPPPTPPQMVWMAAPDWSFAHRIDTHTGRVLCTGESAADVLELGLVTPYKRKCNNCLAVVGRSAL